MTENNTKYFMQIYISVLHLFHVFCTRTGYFINSESLTIFAMFHHVSRNIHRNASWNILVKWHTDFIEMALLKFWFAAAMLPERILTATMLTAASQSQIIRSNSASKRRSVDICWSRQSTALGKDHRLVHRSCCYGLGLQATSTARFFSK